MRNFVAFCELPEIGVITEPFKIAGVPKRITGKAHSVRRRSAADPISPKEVAAIISKLPEWGGRREPKRTDFDRKRKYKVQEFPIKARFIVAYETGLRPSTLDAISVPEHYEPGSATLRLTDEIDKQRWGREVPLSQKAREARPGLPQGRSHLRLARLPLAHQSGGGAGPTGRAGEALRWFAPPVGSHHAPGRVLPEPVGVQFIVGHKLISTTARYVKPSFRAALDVLNLGLPQKKAPKRKTA